ncbi:PREDICTED: uncharacterized protein LOC108446649 [Corvus brachyrhynchos]|uniref:uncharacterized protein LOC108446649 n=1 Tax=Corvus brachyrhynchos TaxID=85066 RepID=UPI00081641BC|nr:PREDICTED: uncharacterized protein LOC108446649 [Corvus brachyrhynchos]
MWGKVQTGIFSVQESCGAAPAAPTVPGKTGSDILLCAVPVLLLLLPLCQGKLALISCSVLCQCCSCCSHCARENWLWHPVLCQCCSRCTGGVQLWHCPADLHHAGVPCWHSVLVLLLLCWRNLALPSCAVLCQCSVPCQGKLPLASCCVLCWCCSFCSDCAGGIRFWCCPGDLHHAGAPCHCSVPVLLLLCRENWLWYPAGVACWCCSCCARENCRWHPALCCSVPVFCASAAPAAFGVPQEAGSAILLSAGALCRWCSCCSCRAVGIQLWHPALCCASAAPAVLWESSSGILLCAVPVLLLLCCGNPALASCSVLCQCCSCCAVGIRLWCCPGDLHRAGVPCQCSVLVLLLLLPLCHGKLPLASCFVLMFHSLLDLCVAPPAPRCSRFVVSLWLHPTGILSVLRCCTASSGCIPGPGCIPGSLRLHSQPVLHPQLCQCSNLTNQ